MTAVEWLEKQLDIDLVDNGWYFEKAKEMEKQEQQKLGIILAIFAEEIGDKKCTELLNKAKQYYNKTFKSE